MQEGGKGESELGTKSQRRYTVQLVITVDMGRGREGSVSGVSLGNCVECQNCPSEGCVVGHSSTKAHPPLVEGHSSGWSHSTILI